MTSDPTPANQPLATRRNLEGALLAPPALRRLLIIGGPLLVVAAFVVAYARHGTPLFWVLVGAGAVLVAVAARTHGADRGCAFCGVDREHVPFLITGPALSICPECAAAASAQTAEELDRRGLAVEWARLFLGGLPERAPLALSRPYVELVAGSDRSPEGVRASLVTCFRFGHHRLAQELLESIPEAARTPSDWNSLGFALGEQGFPAEALAATRRAAACGGEQPDPWTLANTAWYELQLHPGATGDDLARWLGQVAEARRLLEARCPAGPAAAPWLHALASFRGIEAELLRRAGDGEGALRRLAEADAQTPPTGERLLLRARALAALGRAAECRAEAERALTLLRPDARAAEEARRLARATSSPVAPPER